MPEPTSPASATSVTFTNKMSLFKTNEKNTIDLMKLLPDDYDTSPKIGTSVKPGDAATFHKVVKGALRKIPHCDPTVSRGIGMLELICENPEWTCSAWQVLAWQLW